MQLTQANGGSGGLHRVDGAPRIGGERAAGAAREAGGDGFDRRPAGLVFEAGQLADERLGGVVAKHGEGFEPSAGFGGERLHSSLDRLE